MEYIKNCDYEYIMNKYHDQNGPFDAHRRFVRQDALFSESSGMAPEAIHQGVDDQDATISHLPHPVRKARALAFVLKNTRISCDKRDPYPAINMVDRPLTTHLILKWKKELFRQILPEVGAKIDYYNNNGIVTIWPDFDHSVPIWDIVFKVGFTGLLENSRAARGRFENLTEEQAAFFDGIDITYTAILEFLERLENQAVTDGNPRMAQALHNIKQNPPATFYEVLLLDYIYFMICEHIESLQVNSICHFDRLLLPYYENDLKNGVPEEQIRQDLAYFLLQFTAIGNYWGQPVFLGGCKEDESTHVNALSYLFMDVYDKMGIHNPKVQIRLARSTPKDFLLKALDMIRRGRGGIVFVSDAVIRKALEKLGFTAEQARMCDVKGCYEYSVQGGFGCGMNYLNLLKPLEYALHKGCDGVSGVFAGLESPDVTSYETFDSLLAEYKRQLVFLIDSIIQTVDSFEDHLSYVCPQSMLSATFPVAMERGKDPMQGGGVSNFSRIEFGFMADIADSLTAIKKFVYDRKQLTLAQFVEILDKDFEGYETFRLQLRADRDKFGNNKALPDDIAKELADYIIASVCGRPNAPKRGGTWNIGFHMARQSYDQAPKTAASPNGRRRGDELSKNLSASMGMNREGATAAILSTTKIDATAFDNNACLDLGLLPSAVAGDDGLEAMYGLLMTFINRGGHALNMNVFDAETLRNAQKEPEKYQDLQIRVAGWNVLFNNICKEEQDGFIRQAESLV